MTKDDLRKNIHLIHISKTAEPIQDYDPYEFIDEDEGNPDIFYTYKCPKCQHIVKGHIFYMAPPICSRCGTKMKHADTERRTVYYPDTQKWLNKRLEFEYSYRYYNEQNFRDESWAFDDIHYLCLFEVDGRRGIRIFAYNADGRPLGAKYYYDDKDMFYELLTR